MRDSFLFHKSWWEAIKDLPNKGDVLTAIVEYGLTGETSERLDPVSKAILKMVKPQIDNNEVAFIQEADDSNKPKLGCYQKFVKSMKKSEGWLEILAMNYRISIQSLKNYLEDFETDCLCRGFDDTGKTLKDFKAHFNNWLLIRLKNIKKDENENRKSNGAAETKLQRIYESAELVSKILNRDNPQ